jgi:hypothetical protein
MEEVERMRGRFDRRQMEWSEKELELKTVSETNQPTHKP